MIELFSVLDQTSPNARQIHKAQWVELLALHLEVAKRSHCQVDRASTNHQQEAGKALPHLPLLDEQVIHEARGHFRGNDDILNVLQI